MKKVIVSVINDLMTDQRVHKTCLTLVNLGFEVLLIGRKLHNSLPLEQRKYKTHRMNLLFEKGPFFYAEFNVRLFIMLLFMKVQLLVSNDLDTLLPNFLIHKIKKIPVVYDSHELFTETPEVKHRKFVKSVWERIERWIFPKLKDVFTVSDSIADIFKKKYKVAVKVVRNLPPVNTFDSKMNRQQLGLPDDKKVLILQGSGINIQRGAEELVEAMQYLEGFQLLIVGGGDVMDELKESASSLNLQKKIIFLPKQSMEKLYQYTMNADLGLTLDKDTNLNYRYSLPNKLFDYIQAGIPVLASPLPEIKKIIDFYQIGDTIQNHEPKHIAKKIKEMTENQDLIKLWKENLKFAASELCWEKEEKIIQEVYQKYA